MTIQIYLSSMKKYTEGKENGRWLQLPMNSEKLENVFDEIVEENQEHIILDYNAPFDISEHENIFELNDFMENVEYYGLSEEELQIIFAVTDTKEEAIEKILDGCFTIIDTNTAVEGWAIGFVDEADLGRILHEEGYNSLFKHPIEEEMLDYMDWESIYRDLSINDGWERVKINNNDYLVTIKF